MGKKSLDSEKQWDNAFTILKQTVKIVRIKKKAGKFLNFQTIVEQKTLKLRKYQKYHKI